MTPDGQYRTVNKCQNSDLFFALRGGTYFPDFYLQIPILSLEIGGGGTFGVVLESTILASPQVTIQAVLVTFSPNATLTKQLWTILVDNGVQWANDTWGGLANSNTAVYISPTLSKDDAAKSLAPLIQFGQQLVDDKVAGANLVVTTFPSYGTFFNFLIGSEVAVRLSDRVCKNCYVDLHFAAGRRQPCTCLSPYSPYIIQHGGISFNPCFCPYSCR